MAAIHSLPSFPLLTLVTYYPDYCCLECLRARAFGCIVYPLSRQRCYARKAAAGNVWVIGNHWCVVEKLKWPLAELDSCRGHPRSRTHSDMRVATVHCSPLFLLFKLNIAELNRRRYPSKVGSEEEEGDYGVNQSFAKPP